ncbi:MAG TPA: N-acetylmuramoyl-L-alanine amidase [Elusimicrobiales bacterium]|nr:N-acetylmuramoyl-L-alanine amidase [Elusimicrobiales bacterium]
MHRTAVLLFCVFACLSVLQAKEYDYNQILAEVTANSDASSEDKRMWREQLRRASKVSLDATRRMFRDAAREFNVPQVLLEAIGYLENNWIQVGPSVDRGWGVMHLVQNDYCDTLGEAARLIGSDPQTLKDDPRQNIRGAAALLASYAGKTPAPVQVPGAAPGGRAPSDGPAFEDLSGAAEKASPGVSSRPIPFSPGPQYLTGTAADAPVEEWFEAASRFSGLISQELRDEQARNYFKVISNGIKEQNVFNQIVEVKAAKVDFARLPPPAGVSRSARSADYPDALAVSTQYNFTMGRRVAIDTWVNHWMGVGTYAGAISWFQNPSANASAHFCIRHDDGEITQVISVANTAWHAGASGYAYNNDRSIGVEHEVTTTHPEWWGSEPMLNASARLTRFFCDKYGIPLTHKEGTNITGGILGHQQMPGCSTSCPGPLPWEILMEKIRAS